MPNNFALDNSKEYSSISYGSLLHLRNVTQVKMSEELLRNSCQVEHAVVTCISRPVTKYPGPQALRIAEDGCTYKLADLPVISLQDITPKHLNTLQMHMLWMMIQPVEVKGVP
jgi:hypothetical protein